MHGHIILHLLKYLWKLLVWMDENLPDNKALGWKLVVVGSAALSPIFVLSRFPDTSDYGIILAVLAAIAGGIVLILGGYILFRRAVWYLQDKRPERITTLRLK
jgi:hypothetical protein